MRLHRTLLLLVLPACLCSLLTGCGEPAASGSEAQDLADLFTVDIDGSADFANQVLKVKGKYRIVIRDESGDGRPDHWALYIDGVLRCKRSSPLGYGPPSRGEIYDSTGKLAVKIVTKY